MISTQIDVLMAVPPRRTTRGAVLTRLLAAMAMLVTLPSCNSMLNGWLDPTALGTFSRTGISEIRTSLSIEDTPTGIPGAVGPLPDDLQVIVREYPISGGDTLAIEINELRQRQVPYLTQLQVSPSGYVNLPVVGRVRAAGFTAEEFQNELAEALRALDVLLDPEVTVNPLFLGKSTYSIFGIGVSASNNAPLRAGTFPIRKPDLRLLEAINLVGGLNELVTEVYVFRKDDADLDVVGAGDFDSETPVDDRTSSEADDVARSPEEELFAAVEESATAEDESAVEDQELDVPELLEADAIDPYIYVDGEFVPNPGYEHAASEEASVVPVASGTVAPTVDWLRLAGETTQRIIVVPADLLRGGDPNVNVVVRAGDVIRIVSGEIGAYYVMGQVNRVGGFAFSSEPVTLKAAIAAAGGLSSLAWPDRCTIYRRLGGREQIIQVNLDRIFAGLDQDFFIKRGDIINVGTHPFAPFLQRIRELSLPNPISNVGYGFTYARNYADIDSFAVRQNPANEPDRFQNLFP